MILALWGCANCGVRTFTGQDVEAVEYCSHCGQSEPVKEGLVEITFIERGGSDGD